MEWTAVGEGAPFLYQLDDGQRRELQLAGTRRRYPAGTAIFLEGDAGSEVLVVLAGLVKVVATSLDGRPVILDVLGPGRLVGELSALDGRPRSASAEALSPLEVLAVPRATFSAFLVDHPTLMHQLLVQLTAELRTSDRRLVEFGTADALGRVCSRLVELADRYGDTAQAGVVVRSPLSQGDLAAWAGLSREAVVKSLRTLRSLGWISLEGRVLTIRQPELLRDRAQ